MSGTGALSEFDTYLNDLYNKYAEEEEYEFAELIDDIRVKLDKMYTKYMTKGD